MPYKQAPKSMALKALIGKQKNLPEALKAKILSAPESAAKQASYPANSAEVKGFEKSKEIELGADEKIQKITSSDKSKASKKRKIQRVIKKARKAGGSKTGTRKERMADADTYVKISSDKYKSPAKQTSDPKKNAELKRLKELAKARKARNAADSKKPKPKKQTKREALAGKLKELGSGKVTGVGSGRAKSPAKNYKKGYYGK